jgi:5-methylcytosine-specific restriction endonuclease McrA
MQILALDISGTPRVWLSIKEAVSYYTTGKVQWTLGEPVRTLYGGIQRKTGLQSCVRTHSIIAINTLRYTRTRARQVSLTNRTLFGRDRQICAYCGKYHTVRQLSRDHIVPRSRGGQNIWMNSVTACLDCNSYKGNCTPEEAGLELIYAPYIPSVHEQLLLMNRQILADQMEYLKAGLPKYSRLLQ